MLNIGILMAIIILEISDNMTFLDLAQSSYSKAIILINNIILILVGFGSDPGFEN